jgi:hypothetical protein
MNGEMEFLVPPQEAENKEVGGNVTQTDYGHYRFDLPEKPTFSMAELESKIAREQSIQTKDQQRINEINANSNACRR